MLCPDEQLVALRTAGRLRGDAELAFDAHVDACSLCFELLRDLAVSGERAGEHAASTSSRAEHRKSAPEGRETHIGRYELRALIGSGGMGRVYRALDPMLGREVALKLAWGQTNGIDLHRDRIAREARALAELGHPNVIPIFDVGECDEGLYLVMELVDGGTAQSLVTVRRTWKHVLRVYMAAARALVAVHELGMVHRDVKPSNILIGRDGRVVLSDFGLVRTEAPASTDIATVAQTHERASTLLAGTPRYMAPEQRSGSPATPLSDQYSWCASFFEALHGVLPSHGASADPHVPRWLSRALERGLSHNPERRWPSMAALVDALHPPRRMASLLLGAGACIVVAIGTQTESSSCRIDSEDLTHVWNEDARARVRSALSLEGRSSSGALAERVVGRLDEYAQRFDVARRTICSLQDERQREQQLVCLRRKHQAFALRVTAITSSDEPLDAEQALLTAASLPPLSVCEDETRSMTRDSIREQESIWAHLEQARLASERSDYTEVLELSARAAQRAEDIAADNLALEAALLSSRALYALGRNDESSATAKHAFAAAIATASHDIALQAAADLVVVETEASRLPSADYFMRAAQSLYLRNGERATDVIYIARASSELAKTFGDSAMAVVAERARLQAREAEFGPDDPRLASSLGALSEAERKAGKLREALEHARRSVELVRQQFGSDGLKMAQALQSLGGVYLARHEYREAAAALREATVIVETRGRDDEPRWSALYGRLAIALHLGGHAAESIPIYRRSLLLRNDGAQEATLATATTLANLGTALISAGRLDEGDNVLRESLAIRERIAGPFAGVTLQSTTSLGSLALRREDLAGAQRWLDRAEGIAESASSRSARSDVAIEDRLSVIHLACRVAEARNRPRQALASARLLVQTATDELGPDHPLTVLARDTLQSLTSRGP